VLSDDVVNQRFSSRFFWCCHCLRRLQELDDFFDRRAKLLFAELRLLIFQLISDPLSNSHLASSRSLRRLTRSDSDAFPSRLLRDSSSEK
jgi:hypothetical protein